MANAIFFKVGSHSAVALCGRLAEDAKTFTAKKDGKTYTSLKLVTGNTYLAKDGVRRTTQTIPVFVEGSFDAKAADILAVTGEISTIVVAPKSESNKYEVTQLTVSSAKAEVAAHCAPETFNGINKAEIIGRVGSVRTVKTEKLSGCVVNVAVSRSEKTADGYKDQTDWIDITFWGKRSETVLEKVGKGDLLLVKGKLNSRTTTVGGKQRSLLGFVAEDFNILHKKPQATAPVVVAPASSDTEDGEYPLF